MKVKAASRWDPQASPSFWINHASRLLMRRFEQRLRPFGFGMAYMPVVGALETRGPLTQRELAESAQVEQPTMAALLARMERDGLIARTPHPSDKRAAVIALTPRAKKALPEAREAIIPIAERLTDGFTASERKTFLDLLRRAVQNLLDSPDEDRDDAG